MCTVGVSLNCGRDKLVVVHWIPTACYSLCHFGSKVVHSVKDRVISSTESINHYKVRGERIRLYSSITILITTLLLYCHFLGGNSFVK